MVCIQKATPGKTGSYETGISAGYDIGGGSAAT